MSLSEIPIGDSGFRHGVGVFETVRVEKGKARWRDWHEESIREGAKVLGLEVEVENLRKIPEGDGLWRWFVTETGTRSWWSEGIELAPESYELDLATTGIWSSSWEARYKTLSYLNRIQARREGSSPTEERVMLNEKGEVASVAMANLFWVKGGKLRTPARECGCRGGVVRRWIVERSGREVEEGEKDVDTKEIAALDPLAVTEPFRVAPDELMELAALVVTDGALAGMKFFTVP
ncbi:MAG: 4-amino-4-deoxychorismate lyase [Verrucomicrobia bacterium]|nr:4-amino-4-deoxychorismate lyase [Verrucomicrobiota bacterium]